MQSFEHKYRRIRRKKSSQMAKQRKIYHKTTKNKHQPDSLIATKINE